MDWLNVGRMIAPLAPVLGGVLGGLIPFPGASIAGQALGNVVASALGVDPTPTAVANAVKTTPEDILLAKLNAATEEAKAKWPALAAIEAAYYEGQARAAEAVNLTMRAELGQQHWFFTGWRPTAGWIFDFFAVLFGMLLAYATLAAIGGNTAPLERITAAWPVYAAYFGILAAMVGVYVFGRSTEKAKAIETSTVPPAVAKPTVRR